MSCGNLVVKEYLDAACPMRGEQTMLRNLSQGERYGDRSDYMGQHLGGLVGLLPITPWGDRSLLIFH